MFVDTIATYVKLLRRLAQGGVVLLNEVPANLVLGEVAVSAGGAGGIARGRSAHELLRGGLVLLLVSEVAVGGHGCSRRSFPGKSGGGEGAVVLERIASASGLLCVAKGVELTATSNSTRDSRSMEARTRVSGWRRGDWRFWEQRTRSMTNSRGYRGRREKAKTTAESKKVRPGVGGWRGRRRTKAIVERARECLMRIALELGEKKVSNRICWSTSPS